MPAVQWTKGRAPYSLAWTLLILAVVICYLPSLKGPFVYDDTSLVRDNPHLKSLLNAPQWFSTMLLAEEESSRYYRPMLLAALAIDHSIWGENTFGYHFMNLAWHIANTVLMAALCMRLGWNRWAAWLAAFIFALHPLHAQAVCYISGRGDVQFLGLSLLACHAVLSAWKSKNRRLLWNVTAALLFAAAVLTREMAALTLIWVPLMGWLRRVSPQRLVQSLVFLAAALVLVLLLRFQATDPAPLAPDRVAFPLVLIFLLFFRSIGFFASHLVAPIVLAFDRSLIAPTALHHLYFVLGLVIAGFAVYAIRRFYRSKDWPALFCLLWVIVSFLPISNLIRLSATASDQWIYAASIGISWGMALLIFRAWPQLKPSGRQILTLLVALTLFAWGLRLFGRSLDYTSGLALYQANIEEGVLSTRILNNYGLELARVGKHEDAIRQFDMALRIDPRNLSARANHAMVLCAMGAREAARAELLHLIREHPDYQQGWVDLMLMHHDNPSEMKKIGEAALKVGKSFPKVRELLKDAQHRSRTANSSSDAPATAPHGKKSSDSPPP